MPKDHPSFTPCTVMLGYNLRKRFDMTANMHDLEKAIRISQQAADITPKDHPSFTAHLNISGKMLGFRNKPTGKMENPEKAIERSE